MRDRSQNIVLWKYTADGIVYFKSLLGAKSHTTKNAKDATVFSTIVGAKKYVKVNKIKHWDWCHLDD